MCKRSAIPPNHETTKTKYKGMKERGTLLSIVTTGIEVMQYTQPTVVCSTGVREDSVFPSSPHTQTYYHNYHNSK